MSYIQPTPAYGSSESHRTGRAASTAVAIILLVLSGLALACATAFDFFLWLTAGGVDTATPHAQAVAVASTVVVGWIAATATWWTGLILTIRAISRADRSWLIALGAGIGVGALQIAAWVIALGLAS